MIDGVNILPSPVVETTTTGTWGPLNTLLWNQISMNYDGTLTAFPPSIGCDNGRPKGTVNCYGKSTSCHDINLESFTVTDCKGITRTYSFIKTLLGESTILGNQNIRLQK